MRKDWKEAYYDSDVKPFRSRHPNGNYEWHEDKVPWGKNTTYPSGWDPESWQEPVTYVPVSQAPDHLNGSEIETESIVINFGPHHPSTHGVFRMLTRVKGETILALEPEMGYLHRNHEKIGERNGWLMNMPFTDRLDYLNSMQNNLAYAITVEKLAGIEVPDCWMTAWVDLDNDGDMDFFSVVSGQTMEQGRDRLWRTRQDPRGGHRRPLGPRLLGRGPGQDLRR